MSVADAIARVSNVVLATHINPDGDAIGSLLGFADILDGMGKNVLCYLDEPVSSLYRFLPGCAQVQTSMDIVKTFAHDAGDDIVAIALDCGDRERLGKSGPALMQIKPFLVIDHHKGNQGFGDLNWVEPHRSSTGEMIYDLASELGQQISPRAAECLYAAILTDTGSFRYESTSSHTLEVAAELVRCGVQPEMVSSSLYDNFSLGRLRLMQEVLATLEMHDRDRIAVIRVTQSMLERTFTTMEDTENFINLPRAVSSVKVAVFLKEIEDGGVSVSLRARGQCDVAEVAAQFGGGGHRNASGFRLQQQNLDQVCNTLLPVIGKAIL